MGASNYVTLTDVTIKRVTDKAMLVDINGNEIWFPLSQVADAENYQENDQGDLSVTEWIAKKNGLEYEK